MDLARLLSFSVGKVLSVVREIRVTLLFLADARVTSVLEFILTDGGSSFDALCVVLGTWASALRHIWSRVLLYLATVLLDVLTKLHWHWHVSHESKPLVAEGSIHEIPRLIFDDHLEIQQGGDATTCAKLDSEAYTTSAFPG